MKPFVVCLLSLFQKPHIFASRQAVFLEENVIPFFCATDLSGLDINEQSMMLLKRIHEKGTSGHWEHFQGFASLEILGYRSLQSARLTNHPQEWLGKKALESDSWPWL